MGGEHRRPLSDLSRPKRIPDAMIREAGLEFCPPSTHNKFSGKRRNTPLHEGSPEAAAEMVVQRMTT